MISAGIKMAVTVNFHGNWDPLVIPFNDTLKTVEDAVVEAAKHCHINPRARHLFQLRNQKDKLWLSLYKKLSSIEDNAKYQFRLRFRPSSIPRLKCMDENAFIYYYNQAREDFLEGSIPELLKNPEDGLGLIVTDIVCHLLQNPEQRAADLDIKRFMPSKLNGMAYRMNVKKHVDKTFEPNRNMDPAFVMEQFLKTIFDVQCSFYCEEYQLELDTRTSIKDVKLIIDPYHGTYPGIRYLTSKKGPVTHMCRLEELVFVSVRSQDKRVELARETGTPCNLQFNSVAALESLVGALSGYYRLMRTWTFDLCRELPTPSLAALRQNKCHGPVGKDFSIQKLKSKGGDEIGVGLLRESVEEYNVYKLDVIVEQDKDPSTHTIIKEENKVKVRGMSKLYDDLLSLLKDLIKSENGIPLKRIVPYSDYDNAEILMICSSRGKPLAQNNTCGPQVVNIDHLEVYTDSVFHGRFADVFRAKWTIQDNKEVAVKAPKAIGFNKTNEETSFTLMASQFAFVNCECIINIIGVTLHPMLLVMEYLPLGPLDRYLKKNKNILKKVDLVEAATYLARALWFLKSEGISHHNIRCHNVLVSQHTDDAFKVKLTDPGSVSYSMSDIHWIPCEHHQAPPGALRDPTTDVWALSTTLWQIFSWGEVPLEGQVLEEACDLYKQGLRLPQPELCPQDLYKVMMICWSPDPQSRRQPQTIMRDVNQILYQVYNSRQSNPYNTIASDNDADDHEEEDMIDDIQNLLKKEDSQYSVTSQSTTITLLDGSMSEVTLSKLSITMDEDLISFACSDVGSAYSAYSITQPQTSSIKTKPLRDYLSPPKTSWDEAVNQKPPNDNLFIGQCTVKINPDRVLGEGNYGIVYQGTMMDTQGKKQLVAIKKMKVCGGGQMDELQKEIEIMKELDHKNIVKVWGADEYVEHIDSMFMVMEYLEKGSLKRYIDENKDRLSDHILLKYASEIAEGMDYLEKRKIIHRDLAARNILVANENQVKITDFGLARKPNEGHYYIMQTRRDLPLVWYAIESIEYKKFSHKSDVWSYGVTCWELFTRGEWPASYLPTNEEALLKCLKNGTRLTLKKFCPPKVYQEIIRPCWEETPADRPCFLDLFYQIRSLQDELTASCTL